MPNTRRHRIINDLIPMITLVLGTLFIDSDISILPNSPHKLSNLQYFFCRLKTLRTVANSFPQNSLELAITPSHRKLVIVVEAGTN